MTIAVGTVGYGSRAFPFRLPRLIEGVLMPLHRLRVCMRALVFTAISLALTTPAHASGRWGPVDDADELACAVSGAPPCTTTYADIDGDGFGDPATRRYAVVHAPDRTTRGGDCDDTDPDVRPGAVESFDGRDEDCDGLTDEVRLVVDEVMADPRAVADSAGEYVELRNASNEPLRLDGVAIDVSGRGCALAGVLEPGARLVAARSTDPGRNGGFTATTQCAFSLVNSGAVVRVTTAVGDADAFDYGGYDQVPGAALGRDPVQRWCRQTSVMPSGDTGTPGGRNDTCG